MFLNTQLFYGINDLKGFLQEIRNVVDSAESEARKIQQIDEVLKRAAKPLNDNISPLSK